MKSEEVEEEKKRKQRISAHEIEVRQRRRDRGTLAFYVCVRTAEGGGVDKCKPVRYVRYGSHQM